MPKYIILLRGINVSGQKKMPMAELREVLEQNNFSHVQTYIQSGNVVLNSDIEDSAKIKSNIENLIQEHFGFLVPVLVKSREEIENIVDNSPFEGEELANSYFTLLHETPRFDDLMKLSEFQFENESYFVNGDCVHFYSPKGYGTAKANNNFYERKLKVTATTRNYKTMLKLLTLSAEN